MVAPSPNPSPNPHPSPNPNRTLTLTLSLPRNLPGRRMVEEAEALEGPSVMVEERA